SNGLLVVLAQCTVHDIAHRILRGSWFLKLPMSVVVALIGVATMLLSVTIHQSIVFIVLASVTWMGAGLSAAMIIKVLDWEHSSISRACAIVLGFLSAVLWRQNQIEGAAIGTLVGLLVNGLVVAGFAGQCFRFKKVL